MKQLTLKCDYNLLDLERYHFEVNSYQNIIGHLMDSHRNDASFLKSPIWKTYMNEYNELLYLLNNEKQKFSNYIMEVLQKDYDANIINPNDIQWEILDFDLREVLITSME